MHGFCLRSWIIQLIILIILLQIFEYIKEHDSVNKLLAHLEVSAIMEVFIKLLSVVESQEVKMKIEDVSSLEQFVLLIVIISLEMFFLRLIYNDCRKCWNAWAEVLFHCLLLLHPPPPPT